MKRFLISLFLIGSLLFANASFGQVTASFGYLNGCAPSNRINFDNSSTSSSGVIVSYLWNFGDPSTGVNDTSTIQNPLHQFSAEGNFSVKLVVTNSLGNTDDTTILVNVKGQPYVVFPALPSICINAGLISIANAVEIKGIPGTGIYIGAGVTSTGIFNPAVAGIGTHIIRYRFTSVKGCIDSASTTITVNAKPQVSFTVNNSSQCYLPNIFYFTNNSTTTGGATYIWNFGDGVTSNTQNPSHTYISAGTYTVKLIVSSNGCSDSVVQVVSIYPLPAVSFIVNNPSQCYNNNSFSFINTSSIATGTLTYRWNFGDGNVSYAINPVHSYISSGNYIVKLIATSSSGCSDSIAVPVIVKSPSYSYSNVTLCPNNLPYSWNGNLYYNQGTYYDTIPGGTSTCDSIAILNLYIASTHTSVTNITICPLQLPYSWNGNSYNSSGYYNVTFPNPGGCDSIANLILSVRDSIFHDTAVNICSSQLPYTWNGASYNASGTYLKVFTSAGGCDSVARLYLSVFSSPVANFSSFADNACGSMSRMFNASTADTYAWNFGDGTTATDSYIVHVYQNYGAYVVTLVAGNICGNANIAKVVNITPETNTILPAAPRTLVANRECMAADSLWTNYYFNNNTPDDINDDTLLLSIKKNGNYIGTVNDGMFQLKLVATQGAGSNTGILLTNPLITNPSGFWVMNRYWNLSPTQQPTSSVGIKFYFNTQDLNDVNGSFPTHNLNYNDLLFYKTTGGNPDPTTNLAGATGVISLVNGTTADTTHWVYSMLGADRHIAEFAVSHFSGGGGGATVNGQVLPLKLISFDAHKNDQAVLLQWMTGSEANLKYFEVQKSANSADFATIGSVAAIGTSDRTNYQFSDNSPLQASAFYRLKMSDKDGSITFSPTRQITAIALNMSIYPNPVHNTLSVKIESERRKNVQLEIVSMEGKVLETIKTTVTAGSSLKLMNVSNLAAGSYFITLTSDHDNVISRFEKI